MSDDDTVSACPECDSTNVTQNVRSDGWNCRQCPWTGPTPNYRERGNKRGGDSRSGLAKALLDADPDDVGGSA